ncbi:MAG: response regulator [Flavobacteriales bacterium]
MQPAQAYKTFAPMIMESIKPLTITIVEDDTAIREMLYALLEAEPSLELFTVHASAEDALLRLRDQCPDIAIMDINLPGQSGIDCVRQLSRRCTSTQFLMYTVHDDDQRVFEALKAGANGYILKSSTPDEIIAAILELAEGGAPMSAHVARRVVAHFRPVPKEQVLLSEREAELLSLLADGLLYKEIAERMGITAGTVKQHIHRIYGKLHVHNRTEAVNRFLGR